VSHTDAVSSVRLDHTPTIPLHEACRIVMAACVAAQPSAVLLRNALSHVAADDVRSSVVVPPFNNSEMDGFAVVAEDCASSSTRLKVVTSIMAGEAATTELQSGQAARIMTGAPIPPGATAVCPVERTELDGDTLVLEGVVQPGDHVRLAGDDISPGDVVVRSGSSLGPIQIALLESIGCSEVLTYPPPRVGVLATGDELMGAGEAGIRDSNSSMLLAALALEQFPTVDLGIVGDDAGEIIRRLGEATERCDAVITTGGVSVGDRDVVRLTIDRLPTVTRQWMRVAIKPAKPFMFALLDAAPRTVPLFGLPGNPVSALVSFELFARPALRRMAGRRFLWRPLTAGIATEDFRRRLDGKTHFVTAVARMSKDQTVEIRPCGRQGSHRLSSLGTANALAVLPDGSGVATGGRVSVFLLDADALFTGDPLEPLGFDVPISDLIPGCE